LTGPGVGPEQIDQALSWDRPASLQQQEPEQAALLPPSQVDRDPIVRDRDAAENLKVHERYPPVRLSST
jgi:hypothetical protein